MDLNQPNNGQYYTIIFNTACARGVWKKTALSFERADEDNEVYSAESE
jgi:hypothetical protein